MDVSARRQAIVAIMGEACKVPRVDNRRELAHKALEWMERSLSVSDRSHLALVHAMIFELTTEAGAIDDEAAFELARRCAAVEKRLTAMIAQNS